MIKSRVISLTIVTLLITVSTGLIKEDMINDIIGSIVVCIVSRKLLSYGEIKEGFKAYGLKDLLLNHSELCRPLFVRRPLTGLLVPEAKLILHEQRLVSVKQQPACSLKYQ